MNILVIRHGESEADLLDVYEGRADFGLTEKGKKQAYCMAEWIKSMYKLDRIYSSTLIRASQTATFLSEETHTEICYEKDLMEFNNGLIAGLQRKEVDAKYPFVENLPIHKAVYEQESMLEFRYRAENVMSKIISENVEDSTVAIVSHGGMINQLYRAFLKLPNDTNIYISTGDTGIHMWSVNKNARRILFANRTEHIQALNYVNCQRQVRCK